MEGKEGGREFGKTGRKSVDGSSSGWVCDPSPLDMGIYYHVSLGKSFKRESQGRKFHCCRLAFVLINILLKVSLLAEICIISSRFAIIHYIYISLMWHINAKKKK